MAKLTAEGLEEIFKVWDKVVVRPPATPEPLNYPELRERLHLPAEPSQITDKSLLSMADAILALPPETEGLHLIEASYYWLVKQHAPWAINRK